MRPVVACLLLLVTAACGESTTPSLAPRDLGPFTGPGVETCPGCRRAPSDRSATPPDAATDDPLCDDLHSLVDGACVPNVDAPIARIAAGGMHACALTALGAVRCWGANGHGQLGDGSTIDRAIPVDVVGLGGGVRAIACGYEHTCAVRSTGEVLCWGRNERGQLGDGTQLERALPVSLGRLQAVVVSASTFDSCALDVAGGAHCWGLNGEMGALGIGTQVEQLGVTDVLGLQGGVDALAAANRHACALSSTGALRCWGLNDGGQLGIGEALYATSPTPVQVLDEPATALALGSFHTCAILVDGAVRCWGSNQLGALGDGSRDPRDGAVEVLGLVDGATEIALGHQHSCARSSAGAVRCWGSNFYGELGDGRTLGGSAPLEQVSTPSPVEVSGLAPGASTLALGMSFSCAVVDGGGRCWGRNDHGQLGDGLLVDRSVPSGLAWP